MKAQIGHRRLTLATASAATPAYGAIDFLHNFCGALDSRRRTLRVAHTSETEQGYRQARNQVLILGAGFGGLAAALELDKRLGKSEGTSVLVVNRDNSSLFTPLLWTVADGRSDPNE